MLVEEGQDLFRFAVPQEAVVDEDAGELPADGLVEEDGRDGGIHAPGEPEDHPLSPTVARISSMASRTKAFIVQLFSQSQTPKRKFSRIFFPSGVWTTSGWNWRP